MKTENMAFAGLFSLLGLYVFIILFCCISWGTNIYKLTRCDFEAPYKAELIRAVGVPVAPVGIIAAWMDLGK